MRDVEYFHMTTSIYDTGLSTVEESLGDFERKVIDFWLKLGVSSIIDKSILVLIKNFDTYSINNEHILGIILKE